MAHENKYRELDKSVSKQIIAEFKGQTITHACNCQIKQCGEHCNGSGEYEVEY